MSLFHKKKKKYWKILSVPIKGKIFLKSYPTGIYLLKVNNRNNRRRCEICLKLTIIVNFELFTPCFGVSIVNFEDVIAGWGGTKNNTSVLAKSPKHTARYVNEKLLIFY